MNQEKRLDYLIDYLLQEQSPASEGLSERPRETFEQKIGVFRGLCNIRKPKPVTKEFLEVQNAFLTEWNHQRQRTGLSEMNEVQPHIYLWQGDITTLDVDVIVNAANSTLLGCMQPNHHCIDNIIHTRAGVQLRLDCHQIIQAQGRKEPMGKAKITPAYNLPADYVIHTVGPYIDERGVTPLKEKLLASSYRSCLELANSYHLKSIAFCCISTGEFNFPVERAAEIAIETVQTYIQQTQSTLNVVFNVFTNKDVHVYESLLQTER